MSHNHSGIRKAAILVDCLDQQTADRLLDQMGPEHAQLVRQTMVDLGDVDPAERRRVIDEFLRVEPMVPGKEPAGIDLQKVGRRVQGSGFRVQGSGFRVHDSEVGVYQPSPPAAPGGTVSASGGTAVQPPADPPFHLLRDAEGDKLARVLAGERPQTIALVLSHLPSRQAGSVLVRLAPRVQADVVRRLVDLEETEPEVLREVERALEARLSEHVHIGRRRVAGLSAAAGILEAAGGQAALEILDHLAASSPRDRQLADKLAPQPLEFDELVRLDDASLSAVLDAADAQLVSLALIGAPPELARRFLERIAQPQSGWIRRELDQPGPTRLGDVTEARQRIAQLARRMAAQGRIRWPGKTATLSENLARSVT